MSDKTYKSEGRQEKNGLGNGIDRRSVLRKTAFTTAAVTGLSSIGSVSASDYAETLNGSSPDSFGDHDDATLGDDCSDVELAIGSAIDENSATYADDPAPVMCNWSAQAANYYDRTVIDNVDMTVSIENTGDGWNISDAKKAKREAPDDVGYEPSFSVSVGLFIYSFGLSFSQSGSSNGIYYDPHEVSYNFGEVVDTRYGYAENTGWLWVHLNNPSTSCENINCEVSVDVTADATYYGSGPGPCGLLANGSSTTLSCHNTFQVEFDDDTC